VSINEKNAKLDQKGVMWGHMTQFWDPLYILVMVEARNFKLGKEMDGSEY